MLPVLVFVLMAIACWSALGCDALREFSYSHLEELCSKRGVAERFGEILKKQGEALLALEFLLTMSTLGLATVLCCWIGWPDGNDKLHRKSVPHIRSDATESDPADETSDTTRPSNNPTSVEPAPGVIQSLTKYVFFALLAFVAADLLPWTIARVASENFLCTFWPMIDLLQTALTPLLWVALQLDHYAHRMTGRIESESDDSSKIEEEIRSVVEEGEREGVLESGSTAMIQRVMQLQDEDVGAIMTPRTEMDCVSADLTLEEARKQLIESGHSRMPVIGDSTDDVLGILYAKDLLNALAPAKNGQTISVLRDIIRDPVFVPITTAIPSLLELMKRQKIHISIVHDEYGGVAGLVTMEDILEEIVGEIADEYDDEQAGDDIRELSEGTWEVSARVRLDELNRRFDFGLPEDGEFDTIGGFVFAQKGSMPSQGESLEWQKLRLTVLNADARVVKRLRIDRTDSNGENHKSDH